MTFTFEEMEKSLIALRDSQVVQGQILNRVEQAVERNTEAIGRNTEAIAKIADGFILLQAAMKGMAETMERFVRGLDHNGHRGRA
jgi:hypothetical protein